MGDAKSADEPIVIHREPVEGGEILQITMNRPEVHNAVHGAAARLLLQAWRHFRDDDSLTVAVLHGAGEKAFCSGADLTALASLAHLDATAEEIAAFVEHGTGPMGGTRIVQKKPVITVSQGYTYAGGLELYCHGHIRIAEPQASFSVACRRWGVPLVDGGTVYLPRLLGWGAALPLIITGERIDANRAHQIGLVWELCPRARGSSGPCPSLDKSASSRATRCWLTLTQLLKDRIYRWKPRSSSKPGVYTPSCKARVPAAGCGIFSKESDSGSLDRHPPLPLVPPSTAGRLQGQLFGRRGSGGPHATDPIAQQRYGVLVDHRRGKRRHATGPVPRHCAQAIPNARRARRDQRGSVRLYE